MCTAYVRSSKVMQCCWNGRIMPFFLSCVWSDLAFDQSSSAQCLPHKISECLILNLRHMLCTYKDTQYWRAITVHVHYQNYLPGAIAGNLLQFHLQCFELLILHLGIHLRLHKQCQLSVSVQNSALFFSLNKCVKKLTIKTSKSQSVKEIEY